MGPLNASLTARSSLFHSGNHGPQRDIQETPLPNPRVERRALREDMVDSLEHASKRAVTDETVGLAMREVPRHEFVPDDARAYADVSHEHLGTRILAPSTVARLFEALDVCPDDEVLIVGAGVGYTAAIGAELTAAARVHAIDIARRLVIEARGNLAAAGYPEVLVDRRDGARGLPEYAPYDRILLEAAAVDPPRALLDQLSADGHLVMPLGTAPQTLTCIDSDGTQTASGTVSFAPLLVDGEQPGTVERNRTVREDRERSRRARERRRGWEQDWIDWDDFERR